MYRQTQRRARECGQRLWKPLGSSRARWVDGMVIRTAGYFVLVDGVDVGCCGIGCLGMKWMQSYFEMVRCWAPVLLQRARKMVVYLS
jgi:hypothetical protein